MYLRRLKDVTKKTSFLRCIWDVLKTSQKRRLFWDVSERSLRCLSQWRSVWDISKTSHAGWVCSSVVCIIEIPGGWVFVPRCLKTGREDRSKKFWILRRCLLCMIVFLKHERFPQRWKFIRKNHVNLTIIVKNYCCRCLWQTDLWDCLNLRFVFFTWCIHE